MNDLQPHAARASDAKGTLYLLFRIADQRFALDVHEVIEVLPRECGLAEALARASPILVPSPLRVAQARLDRGSPLEQAPDQVATRRSIHRA